MSKIGYIRVSAIDQNTDRQEIALKELCMDKYFIEKASGKNTDRTQLKKYLNTYERVILFILRAYHV